VGNENLPNSKSGSVDSDAERRVAQNENSLELTVNKKTNEITFKDPSGKIFVIQPKIVEPEPKEEGKKEPLTPDEFRDVLLKLEEFGITWSTDIPPAPIIADAEKWTTSAQKEYFEIQKKYPRFPRELGSIIIYELLGHKQSVGLAGSESELEQKLEQVRPLLTQEYRSEFFFKYAVKVPYLEQLDWEIVVKAYERGVSAMPKVAYALLQLAVRNPFDSTLSLERGAHKQRDLRFITVTVNERLIDKLMSELAVVKSQLEKAQRSAISLTEHSMLEEGNSNEPNS
jgi:hypothetical protein